MENNFRKDVVNVRGHPSVHTLRRKMGLSCCKPRVPHTTISPKPCQLIRNAMKLCEAFEIPNVETVWPLQRGRTQHKVYNCIHDKNQGAMLLGESFRVKLLGVENDIQTD